MNCALAVGRVGWAQNDVFGGGKSGCDVETGEEAGVGDETGSVMMML